MTWFWQGLTHYCIQRTQKTTRKWRMLRRKGNCTEWPRFMTFWRCGKAAKTYMLPRRYLALKTSRWLPWDTFWTWKRSSQHSGHSFNMMVRLHLHCQKDLLCHHLCLQRTSLEDELKHWLSTEPEESTVIQSNVTTIAHLKVFQTLMIGLTGVGTCIVQMTAKMIAGWTLNVIWSKTIALTIQNAQISGLWAPSQMFSDWFGRHGS